MSKFALAIAAVVVSLSSAVEAKRTNCTFEEHYKTPTLAQDHLEWQKMVIEKHRTVPNYYAYRNPLAPIHWQEMSSYIKIETAVALGETLYSWFKGPLVLNGEITEMGKKSMKFSYEGAMSRNHIQCE